MSSDYDVVSRAIHYVVEHRAEQPTLRDVAAYVQLSPDHLQRVFTRWAGVSPKRLLQFLNAAAARDVLHTMPVLAGSYDLGLSSQSRVYDACVQVHALTPGEVRRGGAGVRIEAGWAPSPFGDAFIAATARGVCALAFAAEAADPLARLHGDWPQAEIVPADMAERAAKIFAPLDERAQEPLAVVLKGTNLQLQVWSALLRIPEGEATSYGAVAAGIGHPKAVRAVASAIAANRVGYLVPCHRVLRETGAISGYAWGVDRKRAMLARETAVSLGA